MRALDHIVIATEDLDTAAARFEALGFLLTPTAHHPDEMGTSNRLIQFADQSFVELIEVDRPARLAPHAPPFFGFGAHNLGFLEQGEGLSMLVFTGSDAAADAAHFEAHGLGSYAPFSFGRKARQPDGSEVEVAFNLAFATHPALPREAFFTCHNRFPQNFWKAAYQAHANGAAGMKCVHIAAEAGADLQDALVDLTGGAAEGSTPRRITLANDQSVAVHSLPAAADITGQGATRPGMIAVELKGARELRETLCGVTIFGS